MPILARVQSADQEIFPTNKSEAMASKAITVIARAGWDMPGMRMACKASHDSKFEKEARKDNAIRDASAEIALLRKTKAVYIIKMVAFEQLQLHWSEYCNAPHTDDPDDWYWYDYARECMDVVHQHSLCTQCHRVHGGSDTLMSTYNLDDVRRPHQLLDHKKWPCAHCPDPVASIGNRLETPRRQDTNGMRQGLVHMLRVATIAQESSQQ